MFLPAGTKVVAMPNPQKYASIGPTWYVFTGEALLVIAESFGGRNMSQFLVWGKIHSKQDVLSLKTSKFVKKCLKQRKTA